MLNQDIPEEFYRTVEAVAQQIQRSWPHFDWEDIRQEMWVFYLERPNQLALAIEEPEKTSHMWKVARQAVAKMTEDDNLAWGRIEYSTKHVRSMLEAGMLRDSNLGTLSEYHDLMNGMDRLSRSAKKSHGLIEEIWRFEKSPEINPGRITEAVRRLTRQMNEFRLSELEAPSAKFNSQKETPFDVLEEMFGGDEDLYNSNLY